MLPFYADSTMWGPQPEKERTRLKPGDRLADGRVFMGDDPTAVLEAALERVQAELAPLEVKREEILARLVEVAPEKYGATLAAGPKVSAGEKAVEEPAAGESTSTRKSKRGASS